MAKPKIKTVLEFKFWELPKETRDLLSPMWGSDWESIHFTKEDLIDSMQYCGDFQHRGIPAERKNKIPELFWEKFNDPKLRKKIEAFWKKHPKGEIVWK